MNPVTYSREIRARWYLQVDKYNKPVKEVCLIFGISRKTYYKWYALDHGNRHSIYQPKKVQPNLKLTPDLCEMIEKEKKYTGYGPLKMKLLVKRRLGITISTTIIYRFYKRKGLITRPQKKLPWYKPLKKAVKPIFPGSVCQVDTKYVWVEGTRKYQRTFVDLFSGYHYAVVMDTLEAKDTISAFMRIQREFPFTVCGIQTDNGSENRGDFHEYLGTLGIAHYFIPKSSPMWNGAVERAHGVIDQEYYLNPNRPWNDLEEYLYWYNYQRIHIGKYLNGLTPHEKFKQYQNDQKKSVTLDC